MVEAGGVELQKSIENTQVIENSRRTTRENRRNGSLDVHGMYTEFGTTASCRPFEILASQNAPLPFGPAANASYTSLDDSYSKLI